MRIGFYFLVRSNQTTVAIIAFSLIHGFICTVPIGAKACFSELKPKQTQHISGIIGAVSCCGRIFAITVLSISFLFCLQKLHYLIILSCQQSLFYVQFSRDKMSNTPSQRSARRKHTTIPINIAGTSLNHRHTKTR